MSIQITTESTADLTADLVERFHLKVLPLTVVLGDKSYTDGQEITPEAIFQHVDAGGALPQTSAVSVAQFQDCFQKYAPNGEAVIHVAISYQISACYQNACIAAKKFPNVSVVDTGSLSAGQGLAAIRASELAASGMAPADVVAELNRYVSKIETSFVLDRLDYLAKGGRCSTVTALGANLLRLKPCIEETDGILTVGKKYRGSFAKAACEYVKDRLAGRKDLDLRRCFVVHPDAPEEVISAVCAEIRKWADFEEILVTRTNCTIASHCGPVTVGVMFARK